MSLRGVWFQPSVGGVAVARLGHGVITLHRTANDRSGQGTGFLIGVWFKA